MILTCKRLLVNIFLTHRLSKSLAFCEFASINFEPWNSTCNGYMYCGINVILLSHCRKYWITCSEVCRWRSQEETAISTKPWYNYKYLLIPINIILKGDVSIGKLLANIYWAWGMTYCFSVRNDVVLGAIRMIPEWISSSFYFSVFVDMIPKWHLFSWIQVILQ